MQSSCQKLNVFAAAFIFILAVNSLISYWRIRREAKGKVDLDVVISYHELISSVGLGIAIGLILNAILFTLEENNLLRNRLNGATFLSVFIGISISGFHIAETKDECGDKAKYSKIGAWVIIALMCLFGIGTVIYNILDQKA